MAVNIFRQTLVPTIGDVRQRNVAPRVGDPLPDPQTGDLWIDMSVTPPVLKVLDGGLAGQLIGLAIGGSTGQIQFNNASALNGAAFTSVDATTGKITITTGGGSSRDSLIINSASNGGIPLILSRTVGISDVLQVRTSDLVTTLMNVTANGNINVASNADGPVFLGNQNAASPTQDLLQLQVASTTKFSVDINGNIAVAGGQPRFGGFIVAGGSKRRITSITYTGTTGSGDRSVDGVETVGTPGSADADYGDANFGPALRATAGAGTSSASLYKQIHRVGRNITATFAMGLQDITIAGRYYFGLQDQTNGGLSSTFATDTPTGNFAVVRYSVAAGDTTFKFMTRDNATTNIVDTGVAPTITTQFVFTIVENGSTSWQLYRTIPGGATTLVANSAVNKPVAGTMLGIMSGHCHNPTGGGALLHRQAWVYLESDK